MTDVAFFADPQLDRAVGLIFELASQLHVERQRRSALEEVLVRRGVLDTDDIEALAEDADFRRVSGQQLDDALARLLLVVTEEGPTEHPLREEARGGRLP